MRIVQTVFGVFHSFDLARELHRRGHLERIYSTWPWRRVRREGLPHELVETFPWIHAPEFLLGRYGLLPVWLADQTGYANALAFDEYTSRRVPECDALVAISGSSLKTGRLVQQRGGIFICDRGSSHQRYQEQLLTEEYRRWGVDRRVSDPRDTVREEAIYHDADHITVPSTFAVESFVEMGVPRDKLTLIPYGVRLERFQPVAQPPTDSFQVVFVGGVNLRKGIPYLLQAFGRLRHPHKRLRIVGSIAAEIRPVLARLPTAGVEFLGAIPQADLPAILSSSHVLVLPSVEDGFGVVLGQAMACGCPVLASTNSGGPDIVTPGQNGFLTGIRDVDAMTDALQQLADDPALQRLMSEAALQRVTRLGGWKSYGDAWETLLMRLTARPGAASQSSSGEQRPPPTK
ncbi:glycosyltransferase family 4 protein [Terriglobus sp.]|uniref:glycosyltransferase family 4 protein n=1 Tax=Terriglobus sp. TaxID=1889013 RepID=UPI003B007718